MALHAKPAQPVPAIAWDGIKGLLILFVVFGHMHAVQFEFRPVYNLIYIFHVAGFLILPFLIPSPPLSWEFLSKRFIRYAVPFFWFFTASTVLFYLLFLRPKGVTLPAIAGNYLSGLAIASTVKLDAASGLKLFWFLPALFSLTLLRAFWVSTNKAGQGALLTVCVGIMLLAGEFSTWRYLVPWGLLIAAFMFPTGLLAEKIFHTSLPSQPRFKILITLAAVAMLYLSWLTGVSVNIGDLTLHGIISAPLKLCVFLVTMLTVVTAIICWHQAWKNIPGLTFIGSLSLQVYLIHGLVNQFLEITLFKTLNLPSLVALCLIFPLVVAISLALSWATMQLPLVRKLVFPRDLTDLCSGIKGIRLILAGFVNPMIVNKK